MNIDILKSAEKQFLKRYPGGFNDPGMQDILRKHKVESMIELSREKFSKRAFSDPQEIAQDMVKVISRASMVSMFEKPKFRDFVKTLTNKEINALADGLKKLLHGDQLKGFNKLVDILKIGKLAKWSLISIIPNYYHPNTEVFMKPTTVKGVIDHFELKGLSYHPTPDFEFYETYRAQIEQMKTHVDDSLAPNNAAFSGFLMMSLK
ncbi:MAG: hypothetical protein ACI8P9_000223 [Parasphingorhabdus sp.]